MIFWPPYFFRWTYILFRGDRDGDFDRNWDTYKNGFGSPNGEHWLGNAYLHYLTNTRAYKLRVDMMDWGGVERYAEYSSFRVSSEDDNYRLLLGDYSGDASTSQAVDITDGFLYHNNSQFSTHDRDNDNDAAGSCAEAHSYGGFWYNNCARVNPTIPYYCETASCGDISLHIRWDAWSSDSLAFFDMKIRPVDY